MIVSHDGIIKALTKVQDGYKNYWNAEVKSYELKREVQPKGYVAQYADFYQVEKDGERRGDEPEFRWSFDGLLMKK